MPVKSSGTIYVDVGSSSLGSSTSSAGSEDEMNVSYIGLRTSSMDH